VRLLVVAYHWPPLPTVGSSRWLAQAKYLRRLGHDVTVLTTSAFGALDDDAAESVVRTPDLASSGPLRRLLRRPPLPAPGTPPSTKPAPGVLTRTLVPDAGVASWVPGAIRAARRIVREQRIDCVITTSPHESTHLVGLGLARKTPWIADFRDGWTFERLRPPFPTRLQARLDGRLERAVVRRADRVLAATRPIAEDLSQRFFVDAVYVPNAWDPDLEAEIAAASPPELDSGRVSLVHTGPLRVAQGRNPGPFLEAVRRLEIASRLEIVVASRDDPEEERLVVSYDVGETVRRVGHLPRAAALALQRQADVLLLLTSRKTSAATGKVVEYLAAGKPILALAEGNEAARIVAETGTGLTVPPDDVDAIARALREAVDGALPYAPRGLEAYVYPEPARAVEAEVERAVRR